MESIQSESKPNQPAPSSAIRELDTTNCLRMLGVAVGALRRRQRDLQLELKKPGISADKGRLRKLLTELERIAKALRWQSGEVS